MRRITVHNIVSLDGYYEGPTQGVMDLPMDAAFDVYNLERIRAADTVLLGAASYRMFNAYWPAVADHPAVPADDPMARAYDETNRAFSRRYDEVDVVVVADSLQVSPDAPWAARTRVVARSQVATFKQSGGGECVVFGSRRMWNGLLSRGLLDELHLMVGPTVLAGGTRLFVSPVSLRLKDTRRFEGSDNVLLVYEPRA
jgi:dihydrofolate reductase